MFTVCTLTHSPLDQTSLLHVLKVLTCSLHHPSGATAKEVLNDSGGVQIEEEQPDNRKGDPECNPILLSGLSITLELGEVD